MLWDDTSPGCCFARVRECGCASVRVCVRAQGHGFSYWIPLEFDAAGNVLPFAPFVDSFTLDVLTAPAPSD